MEKRVLIVIMTITVFLAAFNLYGQSRVTAQELYDYGGFYPENVVYPPDDGSVYFLAWIPEIGDQWVQDSRIHGNIGALANIEQGRFLCRFNLGNFTSIGAPRNWLQYDTVIMEIYQEGTDRWARREFIIDPDVYPPGPIIFFDEDALALQEPPAVAFDSRPPVLDTITTSATVMTGYPDEGVYRANNWELNDYWEISFSTEGMENLELSSQLRRQMDSDFFIFGPRDFRTFYSIDSGLNWIQFPISDWTLPNSEDWLNIEYELPEECNDQELVMIRWSLYSIAGMMNDGWSEIKDVVVSGEWSVGPNPTVATQPQPSNGAENIAVNLEQLAWSYFSQPLYTDPVGFRVYFEETDVFNEEDFVWVEYIDGQNNYTTGEILPDILDYDTTYYWKVVPTTIDPNEPLRLTRGDAENVPVWSFSTAVPLTEFFQDFDGVTTPNLPAGWSAIVESESTSAYVRTWSEGSGANSPISPPNQIQMATGPDYLLDLLLSAPPVTNFDQNYLKFWAKISLAGRSGDLIVGVMTDPGDADTFVPVETISISENSVYTQYGVLFDPATPTQNIAFKFEANDEFTTLLMDNVGWQIVPEINPPQDLVAAAGMGEVLLTWTAPDTGDVRSTGNREQARTLSGYNIYRDGVMINTETILETEYLDTDVTNFDTYQYYVTALYLYGESEPSNIVEVMPFDLLTPQNLTVSTEGLLVMLDWDEPALPTVRTTRAGVSGSESRRDIQSGQRNTRFELEGYNVYRDDVMINTELVLATEYEDADVESGVTYEYYVTAVYDEGESEASNVVEATPYILHPPLNLTALSGDEIVWLEWDEPVLPPATRTVSLDTRAGMTRETRLELLGYNLYRDDVMINTNLLTDTEYEDTDVENDVTYVYYVTAVYDEGESDPSNMVGATPYAPIYMPPANLTAEVVDDDNVQLEWEAPEPEAWIHWDDGVNYTGVGTGAALVFKAAIRFSPDHLADMNVIGKFLRKVSFYPRQANATYTINVWTGGTETEPGTLVTEQPVTNPEINAWNIVDLLYPVYIEAEELWIGIHINTQTGYPAGADEGPAIDGLGNMMYLNNEWTTLLEVAPTQNYNWNIQGYVSYVPGRETVVLEEIRPVNDQRYGYVDPSTIHADNYTGFDPVSQRELRMDPTGYVVYRDGVEIAQLAADVLAYLDEDLGEGEYEYYVTALYDDVESEPSNTVEVTIEMEILPPVNLTAEVIDLVNVQLDWDEPGTATGEIEELIYDNDGNYTGAYSYTGYTMATQMSPAEPCQILTLRFFTSDTGDFNAEVYNWAGTQPGDDLLFTQSSAAIDEDWVDVDVSGEDLWIDGDFMVGFGSLAQTPYVGYDGNLDNGRSWDRDNTSGAWDPWNEAYLIRAVVLYPDGRIAELAPVVNQSIPNPVVQGERMSVAVSGQNNTPAYRANRELTGYRVYRDGAEIAETSETETTYYDENLDAGLYTYYVTALYGEEESDPSNEVEVEIVDSADDVTTVPLVTALRGNYPNPFNPDTTIEFSLQQSDMVTIGIYNSKGQRVKTLLNEFRESGEYSVIWNGRDNQNREVASGVYFYRMKSGRYTSTKKMLMMK